jgi:indole-3-glycerol phosphate synthase
MSDVLQRICAEKRRAVAAAKAVRPAAALQREAEAAEAPRGFAAALERAVAAGRYGLVAEIKRASPSRGLIRADFDPPSLARAYARGGATCLSVLTDEPYFQGRPEHLIAARSAVGLPVLRKDFMLDPYQVLEARALGEARALADAAADWGMDVLVEVHDRTELDRAARLKAPIIGINNRNLKTLQVDLAVTEELAGAVPPGALLVSESGLERPADLARMARAGARCFLIGESLMRQSDVEAATRALLATAEAQA